MPPSQINLIMIGNGAVGKTSILQMYATTLSHILHRYRKQTFNSQHIATIGLDYIQTKFDPKNGSSPSVDVKIWDTAGQERFRTITYSFYKHGDGVFFVFDLTDRNSFTEIEGWMSSVKEHAAQNVNGILIGNKIDLIEERVIDKKEAEQFAAKNKLEYFQTSALKNIGIKQAIYKLMSLVWERKEKEKASIGYQKQGKEGGFSMNPSDSEKVKKKKAGCC